MAYLTSKACSCVTVSTKEYFESAEVVFTGKVIKIIEDSDLWASFIYVTKSREPRKIAIAQLEINEVFKGLNPDLKFVSIPIDFSSCHYDFTRGKEHLIYAREIIWNPGILMTGACSGSIVIDPFTESIMKEVRELSNEPKSVDKGNLYIVNQIDYLAKEDESHWILWLLGLSVVMNVILIFLVVRRSV